MVPPTSVVDATMPRLILIFCRFKEELPACSSRGRKGAASDSNFRCVKEECSRLQQSCGVQAGTGCHEGGIILSKKPPEWRLSPPHQRSASDSNFLCRKVERPACGFIVVAGKNGPPAALSSPQSRMVPPAAVVAALMNCPPAE